VNIKSWLKRAPVPATVRVDDTVVPVPEGSRRWSELEQTIATLSPRKLVALDSDGNTLRAVDLEVAEEEAEEEVATAGKGGSEMVQLARLLLEASDAGARRHAQAYETSFSHLVRLVEVMSERLTAVEVAWQQTLANQAELLANTTPGGEEELAAQAISGMFSDAAKRAPAAKANGKAVPKKEAPEAKKEAQS
jgi:hypothetical protein